MTAGTSEISNLGSTDEHAVRALYQEVLASWNQRDAAGFAALFVEEANLIGFDGSQIDGRVALQGELSKIFRDHPTKAYVGIVRKVRLLNPEVAILRAVAGMASRDKPEIDPAVNAIQSLVAVKRDGRWRGALYQNTPAAFHGRPELATALTEELQRALRAER